MLSLLLRCVVPLLALTAASAEALMPGEILVADGDSSAPAIVRVDPVSGDRSTFSGCEAPACASSVGTGPAFVFPGGMAFEESGAVVVADEGLFAVFRVDPSTGNRTVLSGCEDPGCTSAAGSGPAFEGPVSIVVLSGGDILVTDRDIGVGGATSTVMRIDPASGDRSIFSGCLDSGCSATAGTGPNFSFVDGMDVEAGGHLLISDPGINSIFRVDGTTGNRAIISGFGIGTGPNLASVRSVALEANGDAIVADVTFDALFRVDPASGDRTILSGCDDFACTTTTGSGLAMMLPIGAAIELGGRVLATNILPAAVFRVDPLTGDRTVLSGCEDGACTSTAGTGRDFSFSLSRIAVVPTPSDVLFGFESDTIGSPPGGFIAVTGNVTVETASDFTGGGNLAAEGSQFAYLTTGPGPTGVGSSGVDRSGNGSPENDVASMFVVFQKEPGDLADLAFDLDVVTSEEDTTFPDPFLVQLDGAPIVFGAVALANGTFPAVTGFSGVTISAPDSSVFDDGRLGYATVRVPVDPGIHFLEFFVGDASDMSGDTGLLVDNIRLVPEPDRRLLLAAGAALLALLLQARGRRRVQTP